MRLAAILAALALCSCATGPTVVLKPDGSKVINLGVSVFEDTTNEAATAQGDGWAIAYQKTGKNQTKVPNMAIGTWGTVQGIIESGKALNDGEAIRENATTARQVSTDSVKKAKIAGDVKTTTTLVPPGLKPASSF